MVSVAPILVEPATSRVDLVFNAGEDVDVQVSVVDADGDPLGITSAEAMIRLSPGAATPLHTWSAANSNLTVAAGQVVLVVTKAQTTTWLDAWGDAEWVLEVTDLAGKTKRVCEGTVRVTPSRTY